jgi:hypothetical protein
LTGLFPDAHLPPLLPISKPMGEVSLACIQER